jgi:ABC-type microcin C transport system permease subunit YejB
MSAYIARRILLMLPTLLGILFVAFVVVQFAPGGPVDRVIAQLSGADTGGLSRVSGGGGDFGARNPVNAAAGEAVNSKYRGAQGLDPAFIKSLEKQFGFDKPAPERFALMVWNYARFDFGRSYFRDINVVDLIKEKLPVSMSLGIWMTLLSYLISIPLGIRKAVKDGTTKNSFLDEIRKQYVMTARAKGCSERQVLYGHIFRNAMLIVVAGFPGAFIHAFFSGSLLIETIFSLDGLGLLSFESVLNRDYPVVFGTLYIFGLLGLVVNLISDLTYMWIDPRIDFEAREV